MGRKEGDGGAAGTARQRPGRVHEEDSTSSSVHIHNVWDEGGGTGVGSGNSADRCETWGTGRVLNLTFHYEISMLETFCAQFRGAH